MEVVSTLSRELLADYQVKGCQLCAFKEYQNVIGVQGFGDTILEGHANASVSF